MIARDEPGVPSAMPSPRDNLTEAPEGDMMYDACRKAWPDKVFLANINLSLYQEPEDVLRQAVLDKHSRDSENPSAKC